MKKFFKKKAALFCGVIIITVLSANNAIAQVGVTVANPIKTSDFAKIIENVLLWVLGVSGSIALFTFILAGVMYITSAGDEQKITTAKKLFNFTIIGLILILLSYSIIKVLNDILT